MPAISITWKKKWNEVLSGGYVWPTGGVGENFTPTSARDEGCAESDWLRVNLRLWADTGKMGYLDMADREIHNEYQANQFPSGGFGHRFMEADATGAYALGARDQEATWCCVFHGTLGLFRLKSYLADGSKEGIYLNFPLDFEANLTAGGQQWKVDSTPSKILQPDTLSDQIQLEPSSSGTGAGVPLFIRVPDWVTSVTATDNQGRNVILKSAGDSLLATSAINQPVNLTIDFHKQLRIEDRHLHAVSFSNSAVTHLHDVVLRDGPDVLYVNEPSGRDTLLLTLDAQGNPRLAPDGAGHYTTVDLPADTLTQDEVMAAKSTARQVTLGSFAAMPTSNRKLFVFDVVIVPNSFLTGADAHVASRAKVAAVFAP